MITCAITTSVLGCLVTGYLFFRYPYGAEISLSAKSILFVLFMGIGCIPLLVSYDAEHFFGRFYNYYRYGLYFIFIGCIILFTLTIAADAVMKIISYTPLADSVKNGLRLNYLLPVLAVLCSSYALYAGIKVPEVKEVTLISSKIRSEQTIVLLSDIHIHRAISPEKVKAIVEKTNALKPDLILLNGDIIDDDTKRIADISELLRDLKARQGIYFVTGNHEFYAGYKDTVDELQKLGFRLLENDGIAIGDIYLAGIPDLFSGKTFGKQADISQAFAKATPEQFRLLMSHTPADFGKDNCFDLEVSGHTHGGQIFPFHIFTKWYNRYLAGLYQLENKAQLYVSRGAGQWGPQMRFLAPAEITVIKLRKAETMTQAPIDTIFAQGEKNPYGKFFTGQTYLTMLNSNDPVFNAPVGNVTFEPGARTNWHRHSGGQILLVLAGEGRYQERGKAVQVLHKGDVVRIAPDIEHWHGAAPASWFTHISIETNAPQNQVTWLEEVTETEYNTDK